MDGQSSATAQESAKWQDVTELFRKAASEMSNLQPMVHTDEFSLQDSMAAVEVMDPIMDQCYGVKGSMKTEDLLRVDYPSAGVTPTIAVKLFQSLFVYEAAFQDGASLMESLNQCIFAWEGSWAALADRNSEGIHGVCERAILAYCKSLVYSAGCQFKTVLAADIFEDEDFQANYKSMLSDKNLDPVELACALEAVINELKTLASADATTAYLLHLLQTRLQLQVFHYEVGEWVHTTVVEYSRMLKTRTANNAALTQAEGPVDTSSGPYRALDLQVAAAKKRSHANCVRIKKLASQATASLQSLLDTHTAGAGSVGTAGTAGTTGAEESTSSVFVDITHPTACAEIAFALNSKIVKLHQTGPIRRVTMKSYLGSVAYLQSISREFEDVSTTFMSFFELRTVSSVAEAIAAAEGARGAGNSNSNTATASTTVIGQGVLTMDHVMQTTMHVSAATLHLLTRCYYMAVLHVLSPEMHALIWASFYCRGLPRALIESDLVTRHWINGNPSVAVWDSLKGLVVCRSRLLATRIQNMIDLWAHVSSEAIFVDNQFLHDINSAESAVTTTGKGPKSPPAPVQNLQWCSLWALLQVILIMDLYMSLMVEMDLIGVEEWDYFYWYWDYLASTGVFAGEKLRTQRYQLDQELYEFAKIDAAKLKLAEDSANKKAGGKNKKKKGPEVAVSDPAAALPVPVMLPAPVEELLLKGRGMLCRGVYRMCCLAGAAPKGLGPATAQGAPLIDKDEGKYSSWEIKFQHRFQAFAELSNPPPVTYSDFLSSVNRTSTAASSTTTGGAKASAVVSRDLDYVANLTQGAMMCFQHAKKTFDDARKECGITYAALSGTGADKYVQSSIVSLTKVAVASSLSTMRVTQLLKEEAGAHVKNTAAASASKELKSYALGINKSYNKHFAVLEFTAAK